MLKVLAKKNLKIPRFSAKCFVFMRCVSWPILHKFFKTTSMHYKTTCCVLKRSVLKGIGLTFKFQKVMNSCVKHTSNAFFFWLVYKLEWSDVLNLFSRVLLKLKKNLNVDRLKVWNTCFKKLIFSVIIFRNRWWLIRPFYLTWITVIS